MKITSKHINILLGCLLVGMIILWRCERQIAIEKTKVEMENDVLWDEIAILKSRNLRLDNEIKKLQYERDSISSYIDSMSVDELKEFWADYKRHNMYN